jgi:chlorobactene glucosyltransferase
VTLAALWPALPWLGPLLALTRFARRGPDLQQFPPTSGRLLSVVVPARNEAATIETVMRSVLASRYQPLELIVVDDRSSDQTAAIAEGLALTDRRVRVVRGNELPSGWFGKQWACLQGYRVAQGELLVFTDADTTHGPELLGRAASAFEATGADLLTVATRQQCVTFWERVVMPQIWMLLGFRYHPRTVSRSRRPRDVIANGQFILFSRDSYEAVGTHEAVRNEVAEDLALAQRVVRNGGRLLMAHGEPFITTRMYHSLGHLIEGWSKNIYVGGRRTFPDEPIRRALVPVMLAGAMLFWLTPPLVALLALVGAAPLRAWELTAVALSAAFWMLVSLGMGIPVFYGLAYPLGALVGLYIILRSVGRGARKIEWKGRVYDIRAELP